MEENEKRPDAAQQEPAVEMEQNAWRQAQERLNALARRLEEKIAAEETAQVARDAALMTREDALARRELIALARDELQRRALPASLAEQLPFTSQEALCSGLDALEDAFRAAVQQGVEARLLDGAPKKTVVKPAEEMSDAEYYAAMCRN